MHMQILTHTRRVPQNMEIMKMYDWLAAKESLKPHPEYDLICSKSLELPDSVTATCMAPRTTVCVFVALSVALLESFL